ncbi:MAG: enoyl-CoA hydratase/isomerase family protein [Alphaproteobacteria bacterium]
MAETLIPDSENLRLSVSDGVALLTLNRPQAKNALDADMMRVGMPAFVHRAREDDDIRAVIITGAGGDFCSGADVKRMGGASPMSHEERNANLRAILGWIYGLIDLPKPVIAAVDGVAYGGGLSLALTADMVLASDRARFCLSFGRIGLTPDMGVGYTLPRRVGAARAKELAFTGRSFGAEDAMGMGIVDAVLPAAGLVGEARRIARRFAEASPEALAQAKRLFNRSLDSSPAEMIEAELAAQLACRQTAYHEDAVARFARKEPYRFNWDAMDKAEER